MAKFKRVTIDDSCTLCGLCLQPELQAVISQKGGRLQVANRGVIDVERYPLLLENMEICPVKALHIEAEATIEGSPSEILEKLNDHIYKKCRGHAFDPPCIYDYYYDIGHYVADPIPIRARSERKYHSDQAADDAGLSEFRRSIFSQAETVIRQSLAKYKVLQLKKYFTYEKEPGNYYHDRNKELQELLVEAQQLALAVTDGEIGLPKDFSEFEVLPEWKCKDKEYLLDVYKSLTDIELDLDRRNTADYYTSWINTDGDDKYYYDLTEAEKEFREDMDSLTAELINPYAEQWVMEVTKAYLKRAKAEFFRKLDILQNALKSCVHIDDSSVFPQKVKEVCEKIAAARTPTIASPYFDMDTSYNSNYRFYSERECERAGENRRERAYNSACNFIRKSDKRLSESCAKCLGKQLTEWVRMLLTAYDVAGKAYPKEKLKINIGSNTMEIPLDVSSEISVSGDDSIARYVTSEILCYGRSVGKTELKSEYSYDISIDEDYDLRETLFGNLKEVNRRYGYRFNIHAIKYDAQAVVTECTRVFEESVFWASYFKQVKESVLQGIKKLTGVQF